MAGLKFSCNFEKKIQFYRASNAKLSKFGKQNNPTTTVHLLLTIAFPILIYSLEALALNKSRLLKLEHPWTRAFMKVFNTFDGRVVRQCQFFTGVLPLCHQYSLRAMDFFAKLEHIENITCREILLSRGKAEIEKLAAKYGCETHVFISRYRTVIYEHFRTEVDT